MISKKKIVIGIMICLLIGSGIRIYVLNKKAERQKKEYFQVNETVEFGRDFNNSSDSIIDGYTVKVLGAELFSMKEFYKNYNLVSEDEELAEDTAVKYYYVVKALFSNEDNEDVEKVGVNLSAMTLVGTDYSAVVNQMSYELINPDMPKGLGFSLLQGTSREVLIPYAIIPDNIAANEKKAYETLKENPPMFQITSYPVKKLIETK